jgi:hypothetical protein
MENVSMLVISDLVSGVGSTQDVWHLQDHCGPLFLSAVGQLVGQFVGHRGLQWATP